MKLRDLLTLLGVAAATTLWLTACDGSSDPDGGVSTDTGVGAVDSSSGDSSPGDAGATDSAATDAGPRDSATADAGASDSATADAGATDSAAADAGASDSGTADAGASDSAAADAGASDSATADAGGGFGTAMSFFVSTTPVFDTVGSATTGDVTGDGNLIFTVPGSSPPTVLRGVEAADGHCMALATAAGSPRPTWVAYLSTHGLVEAGGSGTRGPQIDARTRIGAGPWYNADEDVITDSAGTPLVNATLNVTLGVILGEGRGADAAANLTAVAAYNAARPDQTLLITEAGTPLAVSVHDIFTGSDGDGRVYDGGYAERWASDERTPPAGGRTTWGTCNDWDWQRFGTAPGSEFAQVGHTDIPTGSFSPSWNSAHDTVDCRPSGVRTRGGAGHVYCFSPD
ncbi:MAG: hypothetical protein JRH11_03810 [Deltaproteobacteria bacterium]|nr:hypothetical protein [Deltaproteobacteria bacterium]